MKMIRRLLYRRCWSLAFTLVVIICCRMLQIHHNQNSSEEPSLSVLSDIFHCETRDFRTAVALNISGATSSHTVSHDPLLNFTCSANQSAVGFPPHFPQPLQEFLRNRHCRAFPTLLTPSPCEDDLYLLLAIKSTAAQVDRRAALRDTWGRAGLVKGRRVKLVFLMGRSLDQVQTCPLQPLLEWESRHYGDILQWDFVDIFFNLTRKEIHFLRWFSHSCSSAQFVFKGDDDVFVNTENLVEFLSAHEPDNHLFAGYIHSNAYPDRTKGIKYYIPIEMYPQKPYPPFPSGGGYLMSRQTMLGLDVAAQKVELFPLDDVFLGMCLHQMNISLTHHIGFMTFGFSRGIKHFDPCIYRDIMLVHKLSPTELRVMWALVQDDSVPCGGS